MGDGTSAGLVKMNQYDRSHEQKNGYHPLLTILWWHDFQSSSL
jgi:hypothetical protein